MGKLDAMRVAVERMAHVVARMEDSRIRIELSRPATERVDRVAAAHGLETHAAVDMVLGAGLDILDRNIIG